MLSWLRHLLRRRRSTAESPLESPWSVLANTGNGLGHAPASLRTIPGLDDDSFEELYCGELVDRFWHQGTIYAATPFAVQEVLRVLPSAKPNHQAALLEWVQLCLDAERLGPAKASHAGLWWPRKDLARLTIHGIERPTVGAVMIGHRPAIEAMASSGATSSVRENAENLLSSIGTA